ncbi:MAG TPA: VOC family protein [Steroidobacteraceae bacterium]|nr:VOC family protein [Steroidobacteraceae bacterium]
MTHNERYAAVDHLIYAAPDLEQGIRDMERLLGHRAVLGGHHPDFGTRNALLGLGPDTYIEIIAPDPGLTSPPGGRLFGLDRLERPRLVTWVLRDEAIEARAAAARGAGLALGAVAQGSRLRPDGSVVSWKVTDPYAMPLDGAVPFLIAWGTTPHPAASLPAAGQLHDLRVEHPEPEAVRAAFRVLGVGLGVAQSACLQLIATIRVDGREVEIR